MLNLLLIVCGLLLNFSVARADLSDNPWLEPNDEEDIAKIYQKNKHLNQRFEYYEEDDDMIELDIQQQQTLPDDQQIQESGGTNSSSNQSSGIIERVKSVFSSHDEKENSHSDFVSVDGGSSASSENDGLSLMSGLGLNKLSSSMPINLRKPNINGLIQKFERASGVNFKSLARKMKGK